jgi:hypothetical protein
MKFTVISVYNNITHDLTGKNCSELNMVLTQKRRRFSYITWILYVIVSRIKLSPVGVICLLLFFASCFIEHISRAVSFWSIFINVTYWIGRYSMHNMLTDLTSCGMLLDFVLCWLSGVYLHIQRVCNWSNTTGATSGAESCYPSGVPEFTLGFLVRFVLLDL